MSAVAPIAQPLTLDVSQTPAVPFWRLVRVEFRKSYNTRAGFWLLFAIGLTIALLQVISLISVLAQDVPVTFTDFTGNVFLVSLILVPMLPILLVTTEWSQRSAVVSFALEPRRIRVVLAKLVVSALIALAAVVLMFVVAAACTAICDLLRPDQTEWTVEAYFVFVGAPLSIVVTTVFGFAMATLLLNTPGAIVAFLLTWYAGIGVLLAIAGLIPAFEDAVLWVALQINVLALSDGLPEDATAWGQLIVSLGLYLGLPLALGLMRILRAEVK